MFCLIVGFVPISGAVDDQVSSQNAESSVADLKVGVSSKEVQNAQNVLQSKKPFGEKPTNKILGKNANGNLELGSSGEKVSELQKWLTDYGYYSGKIDGNFGVSTEKAVKTFQEEAGLIVDGVVGKDTKKAMKNWDKYVAEVQAAAGENQYTPQATTTVNTNYNQQNNYNRQNYNRRYYATAVRTYTQNYNTGRSYRGDCWDVSNAAYNQLTSSGQKARIIQYSNSYSSRHRSVQTWNGNSWVDYQNVPWVGKPTARGSSVTVIK
ncbi:MAG TPA: peptidoglycan-binding protein [Methanothermobacter sp.]|nr:peptidoglycan-binding protein [Methanothermobacter sp.]